jgi:hypothetical protein
MIKLFLSNSIRFIVLALLQIIVFNNIGLYNMVNPYLYVLFILLLPLETPMYLLLTISFIMGLCIDIFSNTGGIHAGASTLVAFVRPLILLIITPRGGYEHQPVPNLRNMGIQWFLTYSTVLVLIHHLLLFQLEVFRINEFLITFTRSILSTIFTLLLIFISQYLTGSSQKRA